MNKNKERERKEEKGRERQRKGDAEEKRCCSTGTAWRSRHRPPGAACARGGPPP